MLPPTLDQKMAMKMIGGNNGWGIGKEGRLHVWLTEEADERTMHRILGVFGLPYGSRKVVFHMNEWIIEPLGRVSE